MTTQAASMRHAARTDVGRARDHNEDRVLVRPPLFVVADGLGGHSAGEVAAQMLVDRLARLDSTANGSDLVAAIDAADREIREAAAEVTARRGMSTTCVALLLSDDAPQVSHVGDSRAYRLRAGHLERLTEDHSVVAELVRGGVITQARAEVDERRHLLTQALGSEQRVSITTTSLAVEAGDRYLLCSDGLSGEVPDPDIEAILRRLADPAEAADELVRRANAAGGADNITVVVVDVGTETGPPGSEPGTAAGQSGRPLRSGRRRRAVILIFLVVVLLVVATVAAIAWWPR